MFKSYLKIALRNLARQKGYSLISITGLTFGIATCVLILLFVQYELSYDDYHQYGDRIYRISAVDLEADGSVEFEFSTLAPGFVPLLEQDLPAFEHIVRLAPAGETIVKSGDQGFLENRVYLAEEDLFEIFTIPLLAGDPRTALKNPYSLVISAATARKYFGEDNPIGKVLLLDDNDPYRVTGVMADLPQNTHLHYDILGSYISLKEKYPDYQDYFFGVTNFTDNVCATYVRLTPGISLAEAQVQLDSFIERYAEEENDAGERIRALGSWRLKLTKVSDIHLRSTAFAELEPTGNISYVILFAVIAAFILFIAGINFINLSTARAAARAKEVSLRKVTGANRRSLMTQFLSESFLVAAIATVLAAVCVELALPYFSNLLGYERGLELIGNPTAIWIILSVLIIAGLISGIYPAFYLSAYNPATILRSKLLQGMHGAKFRKVLVVAQFSISIALVICVGTVFRQMCFIQNADLGWETGGIVQISADKTVRGKWPQIKSRLLQNPNIIAATASKRAPLGRLLDAPGYRTEVYGEVVANTVNLSHCRTDFDFIKTYGVEIAAGRDLSPEFATDPTEAFLLNETAARQLGWKSPEDAIGAPIATAGRTGSIVGVVKDFHYESIHRIIAPMLIYLQPGSANVISLRLASGNVQETLAYVGEVWEEFRPGYPLDYIFANERHLKLYNREQRLMQMFGYFSLLAVVIACLGLFGLTSFTAERRTKEIGIRKVLGASVTSIVQLLSGEFLLLVLLANLAAWPVAWFVMDRWLRNFAYRAEMSPEIFFLSAVLALVIALITVSYQALRAAAANPVDSLRYE